MRKTKKLVVYSVLQALFVTVVPLVFFFLEYGTSRAGLEYKLPLVVILLCIMLVVVAKNTLLKPRIAKLTSVIAQHAGDLAVESDPAKVRNLESELKQERTTETLLNALVPFLMLLGLWVLCKALESAVIVLSGAVGFTLGSFAVSTVFGMLAAREVQGKHRKKEKAGESR